MKILGSKKWIFQQDSVGENWKRKIKNQLSFFQFFYCRKICIKSHQLCPEICILFPEVVQVKSTHMKQNIEARSVMNVAILKQKSKFQQWFFREVGELDVPKQRNLIDKMQPGFHLPLKKTTQQKGMVYYSNMDFSKKNGDARHQPCLIVLKSQNVTRPHPTSNLYKCNSNTNTQQWSRRKQQHDVGAKERQNCPFSDGCRLTHKESTKQQ